MKNKCSFIVVLTYLIFEASVNGQTIQKTYGSTLDDYGNQIIMTLDNNFIIVGTYGTTGGAYLIKVDSLGNSIWQKTFNPPSASYFHYDYSIQQTQDSGYIITGTLYYTSIESRDICLIRTNSLGDTLWTKMYAGPNPGSFKAMAYDIAITADSGYAIVGTEIGSTNKNVFLIKTDDSGNVQWSKYYGGTSDDEGYSLKQTSDGGYIIGGYTNSFGQGGWDVYLLKVSSTGNLQWINTYGGDSNEIGKSVKQTSDNGFIATGYTSSSGAGQEDVYLLKTDSAGNVLWSKNYGGSATEQGNDVIQKGSNFVIIGETRNFSQGLKDVYFIKTDSLGNQICKQDTALTYRTDLPWIMGTGGIQNNGNTFKSDVIVLANPDTASYNPCVCIPPVANFQSGFTDACGYFLDYSTWGETWYWNFGDSDTSSIENPSHCFPNGIWYVCLTVTNDCGTDTYCDSVYAYMGINESLNNRIKLFIAPNPFDNITTVTFENIKKESLKLLLINPIGQTVLKFDNITTDKIQIEKNGLQSGLYFVQLIKDNQMIGADKIIIK